MSLHLTPAMLVASYEYLRTTLPFRGWKLPDPDDVEFRVIRAPRFYADCEIRTDSAPLIRVSQLNVRHTRTLMRVMGHEMCHLHLDGKKLVKSSHGPEFQAAARRVCAVHGFDPGEF